MTIIISTNGNKAVKVEKSSIDREDYLQKYIYENPESIPLYEIREDIKLLILAREFQTNSGPIDAIGIDATGELYIVETKLYKNPDKRTVVSQALDYGAALWKHASDFNEFLSVLDNHTQKVFCLRTTEKIKEFFNLSDEEVTFALEKAKSNLNGGIFHFVVLMNQLDDRLKDLILFVNQNSQFDIYAVELEYYKHDTCEIVIPKIFGTEVKKDIEVSSSVSVRKKWTESMVLEDARKNYSTEEFKAFETIYNFSKEYANEVRFGTGLYGTFSPIFSKVSDKSLYTLGSDQRLSFNFHWIENKEFVYKYKKAMEEIGFNIPENYELVRPSVKTEEWSPRVQSFIEKIKELIV